MQLVADDGDIGPLRGQLAPGFAQHGLAEAVVLPDEVGALQGLVLSDHLHERCHAHVGMRVEAKVPEAALLVREGGVHGRIVQEHHTLAGLALVVLVDRVDERSGRGR